MIKTAIFDFDGTLADTIPLCREAFRRAVRELDGRTLTDEEIERQFGPDDLGVIQRLLPGKPELHEKGRELFIRHYCELHPELAPSPFPGTAEMLSGLRSRGVRLAMVTGKRLESAEISLQFFHLTEFFPILETGSPEGGVKPDRIRRALNRLDSSAGEAIYIGDSPADVDACRAVPIRILAAGWAAEADVKGLEERRPDYLLTRFEDLDRFFREHDGNEGL
ncbi:MAG: HAD family hydrolase [Akkermansia sp.]|uniref:HAD family hydrolase n=1 Tax=Akkermansia sp. TaxID=1872421 RepID=UPI0025C26AEC|nr:HAD family hydrolase [Akkermansia sp.]MBS5507769.1 HAD family hydrolase [Akkermansia sp.]